MRDERCRWVRDRLPLLAGGDLGVEDRRVAERHLIGCPDCRDRRASFDGPLRALRSAAELAPGRPDVPSVWPALARQIRESRHRPARPAWGGGWLDATRIGLGFWPSMGAVLGLCVVLIGVTRFAHQDFPAPRGPETPAVVRSEPVLAEPAGPPAPTSPAGRPSVLMTDRVARPEIDRFAPPQTLRVYYDLDYATPAGLGSRDPQRSY